MNFCTYILMRFFQLVVFKSFLLGDSQIVSETFVVRTELDGFLVELLRFRMIVQTCISQTGTPYCSSDRFRSLFGNPPVRTRGCSICCKRQPFWLEKRKFARFGIYCYQPELFNSFNLPKIVSNEINSWTRQ